MLKRRYSVKINSKTKIMTKLFCDNDSKCCINLRDWGLLLFRVVLGAFMLTHGIPKLMNFAAVSENFPPMLGLSSKMGLILIIFAEVFASIALILGLFTRLATIPLIIGLGVAAFVGHAGDPFGAKELPLLYTSMYVVLLLTGPGKISLDALIYNRFCPSSRKKNNEISN